jgi:hypothetical protein
MGGSPERARRKTRVVQRGGFLWAFGELWAENYGARCPIIYNLPPLKTRGQI